MKEYIERNSLIVELMADLYNDANVYGSHDEKEIRDAKYEFAIEVLREAYAVNVAPVRRGKWIMDDYLHRYRCSECDASQPYEIVEDGEKLIFDYWDCNFCPICGADMREREE